MLSDGDEFSCSVGWTPLSTIKLDWSVKIRSMQDSEFCNIWVGSDISWCNPWVETKESNLVPSIVVESPDHHDFYTFFIEELRNTAFKGKFLPLFFPFFLEFWNYQLNWKCEYMKRNSWMFLQIYWPFLTFSWFNEYFEWVDRRYMNFLPLRTNVYSIFAFVVGEKEKVF